MQPWELGTKCDGNFILTFTVAKIRCDGIMAANIFIKNCYFWECINDATMHYK